MRNSAAGVLALALLALTARPARALNRGDWARYQALPTSEYGSVSVTEVTLIIGESADRGYATWQMIGTRAQGGRFLIEVESQRVPMTTPDGGLGQVRRYIFKSDTEIAIEYLDRETESALLPIFQFREHMVPVPAPGDCFLGGFAAAGSYLGHPLHLVASGQGRDLEDLGGIRLLVLDPGLLIGTARTHRDIETGRTPDLKYRTRPLEDADREEQIAAGFNLFLVPRGGTDWFNDRPVFFKGPVQRYPDTLYRSNYLGIAMFVDEPAIRMNCPHCSQPTQPANLLAARVKQFMLSTGHYGARQVAKSAGADLGLWDLHQPDDVIWETPTQTAYYQLRAGAPGIVQEGRYHLGGYTAAMANLFGPGLTLTAEEMLLLEYAFMRGAARCFDGAWGMAIYGQAEPELAPLAVRLACDLGARYVWFWTGGGSQADDHHVPYVEQLALAKVARDAVRERTGADRAALLRQARVAVAWPEGYTLDFGAMWGRPEMRLDQRNSDGVPYGDVIAAAMWEGVLLAKHGIPFDFVVDDEHARRAGYERIIRVRTDGTIEGGAVDPLRPDSRVALSADKTEPLPEPAPPEDVPEAAARRFADGAMTPDGDLREWNDARWLSLGKSNYAPGATEQWKGDGDLSARFAFGCTPTEFCVAAVVRDDVHSQSHHGASLWQGDSIQVALDPLLDRRSYGYAPDDVEFGLALSEGAVETYRWEGRLAGAPGPLYDARCAVVRRGDETIYEAAIPFWLIKPVGYYPSRLCGLNFLVNDADADQRKGFMQWTRGMGDHKGPAQFGLLRLGTGWGLAVGQAAMGTLDRERSVAPRGERLTLALSTYAPKPTRGTVRVALGAGATAVSDVIHLEIPAGRNRRLIHIATAELAPGAYHLRAELRAGGDQVATVESKVYVTPWPPLTRGPRRPPPAGSRPDRCPRAAACGRLRGRTAARRGRPRHDPPDAPVTTRRAAAVAAV